MVEHPSKRPIYPLLRLHFLVPTLQVTDTPLNMSTNCADEALVQLGENADRDHFQKRPNGAFSYWCQQPIIEDWILEST